jgi:predicted nuclease with TOPRIM domain
LTRAGADPTPPEVAAALKDADDLGDCGRRLKQVFPEWNEQKRLAEIRQYLSNQQYRWQANPERKAREVLVREREQDPEKLAAARDEIDQLRRDKTELEDQVGELEDEVARLEKRI